MATLAKIAARPNLDGTGITPALADQMYSALGSYHMAIVELRVAETSEKDDDNTGVKLVVETIEPATSSDSEAHLRDLSRALWRERNPQTTLDSLDEVEPTTDQILRDGGALIDA